MTTVAAGSIAYCSPIGYAISYTCSGPSCSFLEGFPIVACTDNASTTSCTNGLTCPAGSFAGDFRVQQTASAVTLESILDMGDCGSLRITSDGRPAGTKYEIIT